MFVKLLLENYRILKQSYRNLVLFSLAIVLVLMILMVRFWPAARTAPALNFEITEQEMVFLDEIIITRQQSAPAAPVKPQIPVPVPNDEIIPEEIDIEIELDLSRLPPLEPGTGSGTGGDSARIAANPQRAPSVVRIVEASARQFVPDAYRGRLEIIVNFLVDENGEVEEAHIMEFRLYNDNGGYEALSSVPDELMEAVVNAASQWRFRPAIDDGEAVKAFARQRFNY